MKFPWKEFCFFFWPPVVFLVFCVWFLMSIDIAGKQCALAQNAVTSHEMCVVDERCISTREDYLVYQSGLAKLETCNEKMY